MKEIWLFRIMHHGNVRELSVDHSSQLRCVRFVLMSCLSWFVVNPQATNLPRSEAICKWKVFCFYSCSCYLTLPGFPVVFIGKNLAALLDQIRNLMAFNRQMRVFIAPPTERYLVRTYKEDLKTALVDLSLVLVCCLMFLFYFLIGFSGELLQRV